MTDRTAQEPHAGPNWRACPPTGTVAEATELARLRQALHAWPELAFQELQTAAFVVQRLQEAGCDRVLTGIGGTGVVGVIEGRANGPTVGLRAELDALPIVEATPRPYASRRAGCMHACGHDGHMAMLLGAARSLAARRDFAGRVALVFQPAEEAGRGGAAMLADGLLARVPLNLLFGLHNWPGLPEGRFYLCEGPIMAAVAELTIRIVGRGAHAALPETGIDSLFAAAQMVTALQGVVSRSLSAQAAAVLTIGEITGNGAWNVIPGEVTLRGTARWFAEEVGARIETRLREVVEGTARAAGASADLLFHRHAPAVANDAGATAIARSAALEVAGREGLERLAQPVMAGDDIGVLLRAVPGCYLLIGAGVEAVPLHHPSYDFNDALLPRGAAWLAAVARRALGSRHREM